MAFTNSNDTLTGRKPVVTLDESCTVAQRYAVSLATGDLVLNKVGAVGILPAGCVPVNVYLDSDDLDSNGTPTIDASIGLLIADGTDLSTATADGGAVWGSGITTCQAGGMSQVLSKALSRVQAAKTDRKIGIKFTTAAATAVAGEIGVTISYRPV